MIEWAARQEERAEGLPKGVNVQQTVKLLTSKGHMGASDWNYELRDGAGWIIYSCGECCIGPLCPRDWYRLVKCVDKLMVKDQYTTKYALWHCPNCISEHKNMHDKRLLVLKKPNGEFMLDYIGTVSNGYENKIRYLQLSSLLQTIVNTHGEEIELTDEDMLEVMEGVQNKV